LRETSHRFRDDRKTAALLAGTRGFDRAVSA
jgi:hypothetical protein